MSRQEATAMVDPWTYFLVEEIIFPEESGGVTGEGAFGMDDHPAEPCPAFHPL
jgi:hypothetical protein